MTAGFLFFCWVFVNCLALAAVNFLPVRSTRQDLQSEIMPVHPYPIITGKNLKYSFKQERKRHITLFRASLHWIVKFCFHLTRLCNSDPVDLTQLLTSNTTVTQGTVDCGKVQSENLFTFRTAVLKALRTPHLPVKIHLILSAF